MSEIEDRRQRACEAGYDAIPEHEQYPPNSCIETAVETATRVKITDEIMFAALDSVFAGRGAYGRYHTAVKAAFKAAGFEVVP